MSSDFVTNLQSKCQAVPHTHGVRRIELLTEIFEIYTTSEGQGLISRHSRLKETIAEKLLEFSQDIQYLESVHPEAVSQFKLALHNLSETFN